MPGFLFLDGFFGFFFLRGFFFLLFFRALLLLLASDIFDGFVRVQ